jgi:hypothetical protein
MGEIALPAKIEGRAILASLEARKDEIVASYKRETQYDQDDVAFLWRDLNGFLSRFDLGLRIQQDLMAADANRYQPIAPHCRIAYRPWGKVLIVLPTNALIPLMPMISASFVAMGNRVEVAFPGRLRETADLLSAVMANHLGSKFGALGAGIRDVVYGRLESGVDFLYYIGGSAHKRDIVTACLDNHTDFVFEGEGKSIAIVDGETEEHLRKAAESILTAKTRCLGRLCTSPNTVLASRRSAAALIAALVAGSGASSLTAEEQRASELRAFDTAQHVYRGERGGRPVGWATFPIDAVPINQDLFCSSFFVATYEDEAQLRSALVRYDGGIEAALYVERDSTQYEELALASTGIGRLTLGRDPTIQDSLLPWGGYKSGGPSRVATFFDKAVRRIIVES